jgi:hypothetical protein
VGARPILVSICIGMLSAACSSEVAYTDFTHCFNEELKKGADKKAASEYCRRFTTVVGEGVRNKPYKLHRDDQGVEYILIEGRKVTIEKKASNELTGERIGLVADTWVLIE